MRRALAWASAIPLILAGSQAAHVVAYRLVYPSAQMRLHALLATGHSYMQLMPFALAVAGAVAFVSLVSAVAQAARGRPVFGVPPSAFALLPLAAFTLQEFLERSLHTGTFMWQTFESPTFLPGLALQLPFAAAVYAAARLLLRAAQHVGDRLAGRPAARRAPAPLPPSPPAVPLPQRRPIAYRLAKRGPPLLLA
jgi:hypothetical protein